MSAEVSDRQKAMEMPARCEAKGKVVLMEEAVDCSQDDKGIKEVTAVKDAQMLKMVQWI